MIYRLERPLVTMLLAFSMLASGCSLDASLFGNKTDPSLGGGNGNDPDDGSGDTGGIVDSTFARLKYTFNGPITDHVIDGTTAYIGGAFSTMGKSSFGPMIIDNTQKVVQSLKVSYSGAIYAAAQDTQGRTYLFGNFTVAAPAGSHLIRLTPEGTLDETFPDMQVVLGVSSGSNFDIKVLNNVVYLSADLISVKGQSRIGGAAFNADTFALTDWNPKIWSGGRRLEIVDSQRIAVIGGGTHGNDKDGLFYINSAGELVEFTQNLAQQAPGFSPLGVFPDGTGKFYLTGSNASLTRILANGNLDASFGVKTMASAFGTNTFVFNGEIYTLTGTASDGYKFERFSPATGDKLGETEKFYKDCSGGSYVSPDLRAVAYPAQNKIYVSANCVLRFEFGGVTTTRSLGFAELSVTAGNLSLTSFYPSTFLSTNASNPLVMDMQVFDNVLYLNHFYGGISAYDLTSSNTELFNVSGWTVNFAVSSDGLYVSDAISGSPATTVINSYNHKTGAPLLGKLASGVSSVTVNGYLDGIYHSGSQLFISEQTLSTGRGATFYVFDLNGNRLDRTMPLQALGSNCVFGARYSGLPGMCRVGSKMGGLVDSGLYVYNVSSKTVETTLNSKLLPEPFKSPAVPFAYFDDDYEVYVVYAAHDYNPNVWASPQSAYARLFVYNKGQSSPLYVNRISLSNSTIRFARHGNKLVISGLAYFADVSWDYSANVSNCTGGCKQLSGLTAMDLTTGQLIDGYGAGMPVSGDNYNNYYNYRIHVSGDDLHVCRESSGVILDLYDASTGAVKPAGYDFQTQGSGGICGPRLNLAGGNVLFALTASVFYDAQTVGPFVAVNMESGAITNYQLDGSVSALHKVGSRLFIATHGLTQGFGGPLSGPIISFDTETQAASSVDTSGLDVMLGGNPIKYLSSGGGKLVLATDSVLTFMAMGAGGSLTAEERAFVASGPIMGLEAVGSQLFVTGNLQDVQAGTVDLGATDTYTSVGAAMRIDLATLAGHKLSSTLALSTYGLMLGLPPALKVIDNDVYVLGLETVDGVVQSIARLNGSTGALDAAFKPVVTFTFTPLALNGLVMDLTKTLDNELVVVGLFEGDVGGTPVQNSAVLNKTSGAMTGKPSMSLPEQNLMALDVIKLDMGPAGEQLLFTTVPLTGVSSFIIQ